MSAPLLIVRPEPGCGRTRAAAEALGLEAVAAPLFAIERVEWEPPEADGFDGILAGSANAFAHAGGAIEGLRGLPVYAVGARTAEAARAAQFTVAQVGEGGLEALVETLAPPLRLLRLAGDVRVALAPREGISIAERTVYRARPLALAREAVRALGGEAVVALHSGEAAAHFAGECDRLALDRKRIALVALAPGIAARAGGGWRELAVAPRIDDSALLALAAELCQ